jgi:hypothetical protein
MNYLGLKMASEIETTEKYRAELEQRLRSLVGNIGDVQIGGPGQFPYGWRKAAKGRTVWRILEELISQNLEAQAEKLQLRDFAPADSEVGVYDFSFKFDRGKTVFVNVKSAVEGRRPSKDDISKADKLVKFFEDQPELYLMIATVEIQFLSDPLRIRMSNCYVVPTAWLPDVYVNPSNNGNLQSSKYKDIGAAVPRGRNEFVALLKEQQDLALGKRRRKV